MRKLKPMQSEAQIPAEVKKTPVGDLIRYQNLEVDFPTINAPQLLIGMCMDNRKKMKIPDNFAFILRVGGANLRYSEFKVTYAIAVGGIKHIALICHNNCGMVNLIARKEQFIQGLCDQAGWGRQEAEDYFLHFAPMHEIGNEIDFVVSEAKRLRLRYPNIAVTPLMYNVEDNLLYWIGD